jgi:ATP-binding protein involved in chromosome partitioning
MTDITREAAEQALEGFRDPVLGDALAGARIAVETSGADIRVGVTLGWPAAGLRDALAEAVAEHLRSALEGVGKVDVTVDWKIVAHSVQGSLRPLAKVKNIIAVASGKGGVGKSTVAANLALALAAEGARVGVLDADIYGPSQPRMLGASGRPTTRDGKKMLPMEAHGLQCMSIGFLIDEEQPMVWRGPMVTQALNQLISETAWDDVDYLIVDMPPGTGDIQLTLAQRVPVTGAVIVTTPQEISLLDARKGLKMFQKVEVDILGIIENMSTHVCSNCGHEEHIFGAGGGQGLARQYAVPFLGALPLDSRIREQADGGRPSVVAEPDGAVASAYRDIARRTARALVRQKGDDGRPFPSIRVEND